MVWRRGDRLIAALMLAAAGAAGWDGFQLWRETRVNHALEQLEAGAPVAADHPRLRFARAFELQQEGRFEQALEAYAAVGAGDEDELQADVDYNLANLYFRRGLQLQADGAGDLAFPLIELAKESYRGLLRADSGRWPAKYNLELALRIAPDVDLKEVSEERNPEHNPRAAAGMRAREALP